MSGAVLRPILTDLEGFDGGRYDEDETRKIMNFREALRGRSGVRGQRLRVLTCAMFPVGSAPPESG
jgi:hypothetical protein